MISDTPLALDSKMFILFSALEKIGGNGAKAYQCASCGGLITHSDRLILVGGTNRHLFVNPAGVECDFHTFYSCPGAIAVGEATEAHTWFSGYTWRMAFCRQCGQHLGWYYEAVFKSERPEEFWGILVSHVISK
ncbi:MAG: hypothetical protein JSW15_01975 [Deltaproteobacteria bacterium]|nr:MAG: hypothetical protein JSW15_01975 [Deltaproteobacteria bacterium]